jgi:hypothetical protein
MKVKQLPRIQVATRRNIKNVARRITLRGDQFAQYECDKGRVWESGMVIEALFLSFFLS